MVREHRSGARFHARFPDPDDPDDRAGPDGDGTAGPWGDRFRTALARAGVTVPLATPVGVADLVIEPGAIRATVDDGRATHRVRVGLRPLPDEVWDAVADALAADPWTAAAVGLGRVPDTLDAVVAGAGGQLLPSSADALPLDCTCAEWAMPCEHVAAVLAHAAAAVAADPHLLVSWRGRERRALRDAVRDRRAGAGPGAATAELVARWHVAGAPVPDPTGTPARPDALLDDLPPLGAAADPVDDDGRRVDAREALRPLYRRLAADRGRAR